MNDVPLPNFAPHADARHEARRAPVGSTLGLTIRRSSIATAENQVHFLCLLYYNTESLAKAAPEARAALGPLCAPHDAALKATGKVRVLGSFSGPETWVTIVPAKSGPAARKGQYILVADQPGAFLIIEAANAEEAVAAASKHAAANVGAEFGFAVEVRPCVKYERSET